MSPTAVAVPSFPLARWRRAACWMVVLVLAGCSAPAMRHYGPQERFGSVATHSRLFDAAPEHTCEAGRRALLSQGYLISGASAEQVEGKKNFQPDAESHLQMLIRIVCVPDAAGGRLSTGFVTAVQDRYTLKKGSSSASLGVGTIGSVSLPFMAGSEAMVKVGSETIASEAFYDSFFDLIRRYLASDDIPAD